MRTIFNDNGDNIYNKDNFFMRHKTSAANWVKNHPHHPQKKSFGKKPTFSTPAHKNHSVYKGFRV